MFAIFANISVAANLMTPVSSVLIAPMQLTNVTIDAFISDLEHKSGVALNVECFAEDEVSVLKDARVSFVTTNEESLFDILNSFAQQTCFVWSCHSGVIILCQKELQSFKLNPLNETTGAFRYKGTISDWLTFVPQKMTNLPIAWGQSQPESSRVYELYENAPISLESILSDLSAKYYVTWTALPLRNRGPAPFSYKLTLLIDDGSNHSPKLVYAPVTR
jgi:hypothetical protein